MTSIRITAFGAGLALLAVTAVPVEATTVLREEVKCPVGGEQFSRMAIMSYTTWGERPDGKPFGTLLFPKPLAECPGNGFVIFRQEFSSSEIALLTDLIATPEYRAMRGEPAHVRAAWLAERLKAPLNEQAWLRLQASWSFDDDPARKAYFQRSYVATVNTMEHQPTSLEWWAWQSRAVNAERELGEFSSALARIGHLRGLASERLIPQPDDYQSAEEQSQRRNQWLKFLALQANVIARRDRSAEPSEFTMKRR